MLPLASGDVRIRLYISTSFSPGAPGHGVPLILRLATVAAEDARLIPVRTGSDPAKVLLGGPPADRRYLKPRELLAD
jgi:hypothetical protein